MWDMARVRIVSTADLSPADRRRIRNLMDLAFDGRFDDDDWDHALGGLHVVITDGEKPMAHASVVQRRFLHAGRSWRGGYVEAVAVHPGRQRRGLGSRVMGGVERVIDRTYELGALSTSEAGRELYLARGWLPWRGETWAMSPAGPVRTADDDDSTLVRLVPGAAALDVSGTLACDWREGDLW
jgi:aminoglycoside 2'-N-acetyltransferase I